MKTIIVFKFGYLLLFGVILLQLSSCWCNDPDDPNDCSSTYGRYTIVVNVEDKSFYNDLGYLVLNIEGDKDVTKSNSSNIYLPSDNSFLIFQNSDKNYKKPLYVCDPMTVTQMENGIDFTKFAKQYSDYALKYCDIELSEQDKSDLIEKASEYLLVPLYNEKGMHFEKGDVKYKKPKGAKIIKPKDLQKQLIEFLKQDIKEFYVTDYYKKGTCKDCPEIYITNKDTFQVVYSNSASREVLFASNVASDSVVWEVADESGISFNTKSGKGNLIPQIFKLSATTNGYAKFKITPYKNGYGSKDFNYYYYVGKPRLATPVAYWNAEKNQISWVKDINAESFKYKIWYGDQSPPATYSTTLKNTIDLSKDELAIAQKNSTINILVEAVPKNSDYLANSCSKVFSLCPTDVTADISANEVDGIVDNISCIIKNKSLNTNYSYSIQASPDETFNSSTTLQLGEINFIKVKDVDKQKNIALVVWLSNLLNGPYSCFYFRFIVTVCNREYHTKPLSPLFVTCGIKGCAILNNCQ